MDAPKNLLTSDTWCRDCGAMWTAASRICHCAACHQTFTGEDTFTDHQDVTERPGGMDTHCRTTPVSKGRIDADGSGRYRTASNGTEALRAYRERRRLTHKPKMSVAEGTKKLKQLRDGD